MDSTSTIQDEDTQTDVSSVNSLEITSTRAKPLLIITHPEKAASYLQTYKIFNSAIDDTEFAMKIASDYRSTINGEFLLEVIKRLANFEKELRALSLVNHWSEAENYLGKTIHPTLDLLNKAMRRAISDGDSYYLGWRVQELRAQGLHLFNILKSYGSPRELDRIDKLPLKSSSSPNIIQLINIRPDLRAHYKKIQKRIFARTQTHRISH